MYTNNQNKDVKNNETQTGRTLFLSTWYNTKSIRTLQRGHNVDVKFLPEHDMLGTRISIMRIEPKENDAYVVIFNAEKVSFDRYTIWLDTYIWDGHRWRHLNTRKFEKYMTKEELEAYLEGEVRQ